MQQQTVYRIGLVSGVFLIAAILLSFHTPWWQLRIGDLGSANFSLFTTTVNVFGQSFVIPVLMAINISGFLLLTLSAILMITYALKPTKDYAKQLLGLSYKLPIVILVLFIAGIVALTQLLPYMANRFGVIDLTLPIIGTTLIQVPSEMLGELGGVQIGIAVSGAFQWTFYLALAAVGLCVATRILNGRAEPTTQPIATVLSTPSELT
jgi:hypothetical protein